MPRPGDILVGLAEIANRAFGWAVVLHLVLVTLAIWWLLGGRLARPLPGLVLSLLTASVAVLALWFGNVFNGSVFALLACGQAALELRDAGSTALPSSWRTRMTGVSLLTFGWVYPHFLQHRSPIAYLYGAPLGLLPCPTLAFALGVALAFPQRIARGAALMLALAALFYGLFGVLRLGVTMDLLLALGGITQLWSERVLLLGRGRRSR